MHRVFGVMMGVAVAKLAGQVDFHRHTCVALDKILADLGGVEARAAGDDHDAVDLAQPVCIDLNFCQRDIILCGVDATAQSVNNAGGLLKDLLEHEVFVALLLGRNRIPADVFCGTGDGVTLSVKHFK